MKKILFLITLSSLSIASTQATNLFVSTNGGGNECNSELPCSSLQGAIDLAAPSDRIFVASGAYIENITIPAGKDGLEILGDGARQTQLISDGGQSS